MRRPDFCCRATAFRPALVAILLALVTTAYGTCGAAAALDCRHPKAKLDRVICSKPSLRDQDAALDRALAEARTRNPGQASQTEASQRTWLADRDAACVTSNRTALERCLDAQYRFRLQVLAAVPAAADPVAAPKPPAQTPAPSALGTRADALDPGAYLSEAVMLRLGPDGRFELRELGGGRQASGRYAYADTVLTFTDGQGDTGRTVFPLQCRVLRIAAGFAVLLGQSNCHPFDGLSFRKAD